MKQSNSPLLSAAREIKLSFTFASIVDLALGLVLLLMPNTSTKLLTTLVGVGVTVYGAFNILSFIMERGSGAYTLELLIGICAAAFGVFSLFNPTFLMSFLFIVLGLVIMVGSICGVKRALNLKAFGFERWSWAMVSACATLLLALSIVFFPGFYGNMLMRFIGAVLTVEAVSDLLSIRRLSHFAKNVKVTYTVEP